MKKANTIITSLFYCTISCFIAIQPSCEREQKPSTQVEIVNVPAALFSKLPNLTNIKLDSCDCTLSMWTVARGVPSPSDLTMEIRGALALEKNSFELLKEKFEWLPVDKSKIPARLLEILPQGSYEVSKKFNKSFFDNPKFVHGFAVILPSGDEQKMFLVVNDRDHPLAL